MRIGITCYPTFGGSGVIATELGKALARRGHEIHDMRLFSPHEVSRELTVAGFEVTVSRMYRSYHLLPGRVAFIAKKV